MSEIFFRKNIIKLGDSLAITIPPELIDILKLKADDEFKITLVDGRIVLELDKK